MSQRQVFSCDGCGCRDIAAESVPMVVYVVAGTPPGAPTVDLNAPGVKVPEFVRELMRQPVARREFCVSCFARAFGLECVEAVQSENAAPVG